MIIKKTIKHSLLLLLVALGFANLYSQDVVNPPAISTIISAQNGTDPLIKKNQTQFILGWNWGSPCKTLDEALKINTYHNLNPITSPDIGSNIKLIQQLGDWNQTVMGGRHLNVLSNSHCIHLEPTLPTDVSGAVIPRTADNTQSVFGFKTKNLGTIPSSGVDMQRFVLTKSSTSTQVNVLKNIWDGKIMHWLDYAKSTSADSLPIINENEDLQYHNFNGKQLFLSINLRAITPSEIETNLNNVILTLKLKYKKETRPLGSNTSTPAGDGYIKFYRIPQTGQYEVEPIRGDINNDDRGTVRSMMVGDLVSPITSFEITGAMLKNYLRSAPNNSITLSAFAYLTGKKSYGVYVNNPVLKNDWWENYGHITEYISEFDVEVDYHGKVDVAIDWIRIETPRAQTFLRGGYDAAIKEVADWSMNQARANAASPKISRFYGNDELLPSEWQAMHYYNKLIDGLLAIELFPNSMVEKGIPTNTYLYNTNSNEMWSGDNICPKMSTAVPYYQKGEHYQNVSYLGFVFGYKGDNYNVFSDTLNSEYETTLLGQRINTDLYFDHHTIPIPSSINPYELNYGNPNAYFSYGTLFSNEKQMYYGYQNQQNMLYNSKPWWANLWINSESWIVDTNTNTFTMAPYYSTSRPKTGEEIRLATNIAVILGTKGLFYWIKKTGDPLAVNYDTKTKSRTSSHLWLGLSPQSYTSSLLAGDPLVLSDSIGGDYIKTSNDPNHFTDTYFVPSVYNWNQLGIPQNRIYIGLKSTRLEIMKINKCIAQIDANKINYPSTYPESLMDLRLLAWKGKGFKTWYNQDPAASANIMNTYIKKDEIKTAKLWQPNLPNIYTFNAAPNNVNYWENTDSAFYDVTVLRPSNFAIGNTSRFYIGVQNRRTDPLFWDITTNPGRLTFRSTAEFQDSCQSTNTARRDYHNNYFWKRLGCRLIRVPLSNSFACNNNSFAVRIKDILADDYNFNSDNFIWRNSNWCHLPNIYIDSAIFAAPYIDLKMLPGEGKIIKVEKVMKATMALANGSCPGTADAPVTMNLTMSRNDSLVYDLVFENNTPTKAEQLAIIYEDASGEPLSIMPYDGIEVADYQLDNKIIPNSKAIILRNVEPKSKVKIGQLSCSKKNPGKFLYRLDVVNAKHERCTGKNCALMNNFRKESVESFDTPVSKVSIVPNPAKEKAELNFTTAESGNAEIMIVDILGNQMLKIADYTAFSGSNSLSIDLSNYPVGMYNVLVKTSAGITSQKFSVMR